MSAKSKLISGLSALVLALTPSFSAFSGCGNDSSPAGCQDDAECKGDRICIDHKCVSPSEINNGDAGTPQPTCTSRASKVCSGSDVYWQNSCGSLEEVAQDCASGQYCNNAQCVDEAPVCTPHSSKVCSNGDVYWRDSCGNLEGRATDCTSTERCDNAVCVTVCTPHSDKVCYQGDAFWQDSCGERQGLAEDCSETEVCDDGQCECAPRQSKICYNDDVYWVDGCGNREDRFGDCTNQQRCVDGNCLDIPMFEDLSNGTLYYHNFNFPSQDRIWQAVAVNQLRNHTDAENYCATLSLGGHNDWRLPIYGEVVNIHRSGGTSPHCFDEFSGPCDIYWLATNCGSDSFQFHAYNFNVAPFDTCEFREWELFVRCVTNP